MNKIEKELSNLGMSPQITVVYLLLLKQGVCGAPKIARKLERPRSSVLDDLQWLAQEGFVSRHKKKSSYTFSAEPGLLKSAIIRKRKELEQMEDRAGRLVAELQTAYKPPSKKPKIEYLEGKSGVRAAFNDILKYPGTRLVGYGDIESELTTLPKLFPEFYATRAKLRIGGDGILPATPRTLEECFNNDIKHLRNTVFVGLDKYCPIGFYVYEDNVSIISLQELFAVVIRSRSAARCLKQVFELALVGASKEDQQIRDRVTQKGLATVVKESKKQFHDILKI